MAGKFLLFVALVAPLFYSCSPMKTIDCPPKFTIYKDISKAYPVYTKDFQLQLKNSLNSSQKIQDTASADLKLSTAKLREDLNQISSRVEILAKSNIMAYQSGICDPNVRKSFEEFQLKLADITLQLSQIDAKLEPSKGIGVSTATNVSDAQALASNILKVAK